MTLGNPDTHRLHIRSIDLYANRLRRIDLLADYLFNEVANGAEVTNRLETAVSMLRSEVAAAWAEQQQELVDLDRSEDGHE